MGKAELDSADLIQARALVLRRSISQGSQIVLQLVEVSRADDGDHPRPLLADPVQRDLRRRAAAGRDFETSSAIARFLSVSSRVLSRPASAGARA